MEWRDAEVDYKPVQPGDRWVDVAARIRDNQTGEVREYLSHEILSRGQETPGEFIWSDGNYSCDCNRALFFARSKGEPEDWDFPCGDERYSVQVLNPVDGRIYYDEFAGKDALTAA